MEASKETKLSVRENVLGRLSSTNGLLFGAAVGSGLTAHAAEQGGADFILVLNAGKFRMAGLPSLTCMLPIGDSNEIVTRIGRGEILGRVSAPVFFGFCVLNPRLEIRSRLQEIRRWGFAGIVNFPTVTSIEGRFREMLDTAGIGFEREVELVRAAREEGLTTLVYVSTAEEARRMKAAGADIYCASLGFTTGTQTGVPARLNLFQAIPLIDQILEPVRNRGSLLLVEGGPIVGSAEAVQVCEACSIHGYIGGSTVDRLPLQTAVRATAAGFKSLSASIHSTTAGGRVSHREWWPWGVIGRSPSVRRVIHQIERVAPTRLPVLILGENGTGKELVARALHGASSRNGRDMIILNCAAIPRDLLESELFGYEPGAFTGATRRRIGKFEEAHGSTLFLDEIGDLEPSLQAKLLRVLEDGRFERIGSNVLQYTDARIVCATNRNIREMVSAGLFREDLYYRLCTVEIEIPPLRDRTGDIPPLIEHFLNEIRADLNPNIDAIDEEAMQLLLSHRWPGNVRELRHVLERAAVLCSGSIIGSNDLALRGSSDLDRLQPKPTTMRPTKSPLNEKEWILNALEETHYHRTKTAALLGVSRKTLYNKMLRYDLL
jgi:two-component system, NtrC family, response regulator AtoC